MEHWLSEQVEQAKARGERKKRKAQRRFLDAELIETQHEKFWENLATALQANVEDFNGSGAADGAVDFTRKQTAIWIRTPGYPHGQLYLELRSRTKDILLSLTEQATTSSEQAQVLKGTLDFDVTDEGYLVLRDNGTFLDVSGATQYLLMRILPFVNSGR